MGANPNKFPGDSRCIGRISLYYIHVHSDKKKHFYRMPHTKKVCEVDLSPQSCGSTGFLGLLCCNGD